MSFFKNLWANPTARAAILRGVGVIAAGLIGAGFVHVPGAGNDAALQQWIAILLGGGSAMIPAGEKNGQ